MKKLLLLCVLAIAVAGCSPSEKNIQKAVAKGDYQYVENYIANAKYWDNPKQAATNAAAVEALVLLNRMDTAISLYKENKGKPKEEMIVKAFVNALANSKPQKMPEKLVELVYDDRNDASDLLLRTTTVQIEPSLGISNIKRYIDSAIDSRIKEYINAPVEFTKKAVLWDVKGTISEPIKLMASQYSELKNLYDSLNGRQDKLADKRTDEIKALEEDVRRNQKDLNDLHSGNPYNLVVLGCLQMFNGIGFLTEGRKTPFSACREQFQESLKEAKDRLNGLKKEVRDIEIEIKNYEAKIKAKIPEVAAAEADVLAKLEEAVQNNP